MAQLRDKINASDCSEENKQCLFNYIEVIKNLCELYEDFSGTESCDYEKTENRLKFLSDFNNRDNWKPYYDPLKRLIKFGHILNTIKGRIMANRMENDDDFKDLSAAFTELILCRKNCCGKEDFDRVFALLESSGIEEKILRSSVSEENKTYLINYIKCVKYCYKFNILADEMASLINGGTWYSFINSLVKRFDTSYNRYSQSVSKCKCDIEFLELLDLQINELERNISLRECSDENKQDLRRYVEVIKSLNELSKEYSYANQPYNREKVESTLEKLNGFFGIFDMGGQKFIEFINAFHPVKRCLQYNNLANDSDFKEFDSALVGLGKYLMNDDYRKMYEFCLDAVDALLKDFSQIEEKISSSSLTDEQKKHLIDRSRCIFTLNKGYYLNLKGKWTEAYSTYEKFIKEFDPGIDEFNLLLRDFVKKEMKRIDDNCALGLVHPWQIYE